MQNTYHLLLISLLKGLRPSEVYSVQKFTLKSSFDANTTKVMQ